MADVAPDDVRTMASAPDSPGAPATARLPAAGRDELVLAAGGQRLAGWQSVRVERSCEAFPSSFDIALTEKYPAVPAEVAIVPGQVCTVQIGGDLVLTGYVDRYMPRIAATSHTVRVAGRGAGCDLRDCTVIWDSNQISGSSVRDVAAKLAAPYGVKVVARDGDGPAIPQLSINLGETPYDVIERCARWAGFLIYDDAGGNLVLARVGTDRHASGVRQGANVLAAAGQFSMDERYSEYHAYYLATSGLGGSLNAANPQAGNEKAVVLDPGLQALPRADGGRRIRKLAIITEQVMDGQDLTVLRAKWEMTRRWGRSQAIRVECDSWRDSAGRLWTPNWRVKVDLPACKARNQEFVVADVTYLRDERGTRADLLLMPPEAFVTEPTPLFNTPYGAALHQDANPAAPPAADTGAIEHRFARDT